MISLFERIYLEGKLFATINTTMINKNKTILVVEDENFLADLYKTVLEEEGYTVKVVNDGEEGLRELSTKYYDLVWLDIMLPRINGIELLQVLNEMKLKQGLIIYVSNLGQELIIKQCFMLGADLYFIKSGCTPHEILLEIDKVLLTSTQSQRELMQLAIHQPSDVMLNKAKDAMETVKQEFKNRAATTAKTSITSSPSNAK